MVCQCNSVPAVCSGKIMSEVEMNHFLYVNTLNMVVMYHGCFMDPF